MKRWLEKNCQKLKEFLKNREVWGIGDPKIKVEKEEVMGKGDITKMKRWNEKKTFKALTLAS